MRLSLTSPDRRDRTWNPERKGNPVDKVQNITLKELCGKHHLRMSKRSTQIEPSWCKRGIHYS